VIDSAEVETRPSAFQPSRQDDGKLFVYRKEGSGFEEVELGSSSAGRVVIKTGLEEGDPIALRDPYRDADKILEAESGASAKAEPSKAGLVP